ncbi:MAG: DnaD domain protein [Oscillospiraceae bacterium]|nr:DnaD domain protein [Oscillospiraceae bacterium]
MPDSRFYLPGAETVTLTGAVVDKLVRRGDGDAALLYIYILKTRAVPSLEEAAAALGRTPEEIESSMRVLRSIGLVMGGDPETPPPVQKDELPEYTAEDIRRELKNGSEFAVLADEVQKCLGKLLSSDDLMKLFGIYDSLGLPPEVILQLVNYCIAESRRRTGGGHLPTMRYIEKAAYEWERQGIFSLEAAEDYIRAMEKRRSAAYEVRRAMGIADRAPSASEKRYVNTWLSMGFTPGAIAIAYERTVDQTGRLAWRYMDSIIMNWHMKGLHTPEEIGMKDAPRGQRRAQQPTGGRPSPSAEDVERMKRFLAKLKEE